VLYTTSCSEMVACARFVATLDRMSDPYLREVNRRLLADEVLHGRIGRALLAVIRGGVEWARWPGDAAVGAIARRWRDAMRGRDVVEPDEVAAFADARWAAQLQAIGIPEPAAFRAAYHRALDGLPAAFAPLGITL